MSPEELELVRILKDPVLWIEATTGEKCRDHQIEMLRDPSLRKVLRLGRRSGKCVAHFSKIITTNGPIQADKLHDDPSIPILTFNETTQCIESTSNYIIFKNGVRSVYKITTHTGRVNYATGNHPYLTISGEGKLEWVDVDNLTPGIGIAAPKSYENLVHGIPVGDKLSRLLGYITGDANTSQKQVTFTNYDNEIIDDFRSIIEEYDCTLKDYNNDRNYQVVKNRYKYNQVIKLCREHNLMGKLAKNKEVPLVIMSGTDEDVANYIGAYWDCDGWACVCSDGTVEISACTSSEKLAHGIQHLLLRLGIVALKRKKRVKYNGGYNIAWTINIGTARNMRRFSEVVPLRAKKSNVAAVVEAVKGMERTTSISDTIPRGIASYLLSVRKDTSMRVRKDRRYTRAKLLEYADNDPYLYNLSTNNIIWDEIVSIEYIGEHETYDLTVPDTHTFISDDIISHNTWSMSAHMLWYAFTHENAALVVAAPYENQITLIFDQLRKFIDSAPELQGSLFIDRRNPQHLQFRNNSYIKGFTAGTRTGAAGGSIRGQKADFLYMDELDYLSDADFDTIYAITLEAPSRIGVWGASTPTGRRGMFYKLCTQPELGWKEFHYPSTVNPEWDDNMEKELRTMFSTQIAWEHEVLAEFGTELIGVFNKDYLDQSLLDYHYTTFAQYPARRCVGVDWNKTSSGCQIVVVEYNEPLHKFVVINRTEVPKGEFTLTNAVNKIIDINLKFNPDFIYVDRGFGEFQIETLHIYGSENPSTRLKEKVKGWNFGSSYELIDPITKELRKTPLKSFMVNQVVYILEADLLTINKNDEEMRKQMEGYRVIRTTTAGQDVYSSENDHTVDALMLAIFAFQIEFPQLSNILRESKVARLFGETKLLLTDPFKLIAKKDEDAPPRLVRVPVGYSKKNGSAWGPRGTSTYKKRASW